jgi:hypothetical protein
LPRVLGLPLVALAAAWCAAGAGAAGGNYVIQGGTAFERAQVHAALQASSFNWSIVPQQITIAISTFQSTEAVPGEIWIDPGLLDSGGFAWGFVQHEYAHQVDFFLLDQSARDELEQALGGTAWCYGDRQDLMHSQYGCERLASTIAWAYWQSSDNSMKPSMISGESGGMAPAAFRALLTKLLGPDSVSTASQDVRVQAPRLSH